ncbi:MAG: hypothetical protein WBQ73_00665, partial [Candidatus Babeliales bacterium]
NIFFAVDELFQGTHYKEGEFCAYHFIKKLLEGQSASNVFFIYSTHFDKLTELENQTKKCVNYMMDPPIKNKAGKFIYSYKLSPGINNTHIAFELLENIFKEVD